MASQAGCLAHGPMPDCIDRQTAMGWSPRAVALTAQAAGKQAVEEEHPRHACFPSNGSTVLATAAAAA